MLKDDLDIVNDKVIHASIFDYRTTALESCKHCKFL